VALWLCRQINKISEGVRDIEGFWEEWSTSTDPKMTTDIVLWGRTKDMERIHKWIRGEPDILALRADSPDEWFAFLYSSIMSLPEPEKSQALSRCILVDSMKELRTCLATFQNPLIIVAWAECWEWRGLAVEKGHRIFIYCFIYYLWRRIWDFMTLMTISLIDTLILTITFNLLFQPNVLLDKLLISSLTLFHIIETISRTEVLFILILALCNSLEYTHKYNMKPYCQNFYS
jgi:hypothetical protein